MKKYYTRACNFFYGAESKRLINKRLSLPLCGDTLISFNKIEIFSKDKNKVESRIVDIKNLNKLPTIVRKKISEDIKKITAKRKFISSKNH